MPRSRRRAGVKPGKTQWQMRVKALHERRMREAAERIERATRRLPEQHTRDKYANYPGNR